jgi:hypothetical protein
MDRFEWILRYFPFIGLGGFVMSLKELIDNFFYFLALLGLEFRGLHLPNRHSDTLAKFPRPFCAFGYI